MFSFVHFYFVCFDEIECLQELHLIKSCWYWHVKSNVCKCNHRIWKGKKYHFGDEKKTYQGSFSLVLEIVWLNYKTLMNDEPGGPLGPRESHILKNNVAMDWYCWYIDWGRKYVHWSSFSPLLRLVSMCTTFLKYAAEPDNYSLVLILPPP